MKNKKYIVSGPNGYLAGRLIKLLKQQDNVTVGAIARRETLNPEIDDLVDFVIVYDKNYESLVDERLQGAEALFHLASLYTTKTDLELEIDLIESNIILTSHIINAVNTVDPNIPIVSASTFSAYNRNHEYEPRNLYSATKVHAEEIAKVFGNKCGFITMSDTYGPKDNRPKIHNLLRDNKITKMNSSATQKVNFTHMDDVARAFVHLGGLLKEKEGKSFEVYDILYPENEITLLDLTNLLGVNVEFGDLPDTELPKQKRPLPNFKLKYNINDINNEVRRV